MALGTLSVKEMFGKKFRQLKANNFFTCQKNFRGNFPITTLLQKKAIFDSLKNKTLLKCKLFSRSFLK